VQRIPFALWDRNMAADVIANYGVSLLSMRPIRAFSGRERFYELITSRLVGKNHSHPKLVPHVTALFTTIKLSPDG
jgi:hypothetical protein